MFLSRTILSRNKTLLISTGAALTLTSYFLTRPTLTSSIFTIGSNSSRQMSSESFPKGKSEAEWQAQLTSEQFRVLRKKGTEAAGSGEYDSHYPKTGVYNCAACDSPLYTADTKFKSGCGWPAFFDAIPGAVTQHTDSSFGMSRTEIVCTNCGGHLGHLFKNEGFDTPTNERACVNSVSIKFQQGDNEPKAKA